MAEYANCAGEDDRAAGGAGGKIRSILPPPRHADTLVMKSPGLGSPAGVAWGGVESFASVGTVIVPSLARVPADGRSANESGALRQRRVDDASPALRAREGVSVACRLNMKAAEKSFSAFLNLPCLLARNSQPWLPRIRSIVMRLQKLLRRKHTPLHDCVA